MRRDDLFNYIGAVDDRFVEELFSEEPVVNARPSQRRRNIRMIAASLAIVLLSTAAMLMTLVGTDFAFVGVHDSRIQLGMTKNTIVMVDVNPSIMFEINDRNLVVKYQALNDDAKKLKLKVDVIGKDYNEAIEIVLKAMNKQGYLTELKNSVLITVVDNDTKRAKTVKSDIVANVDIIDNALDLTLSIISLAVDDGTQYADLAKEYGVSVGKATLVEKIIETNQQNKALKVEKLVGSSIQLLNQLLSYVDVPDDVDRVGEAAGVIPESSRKQSGVDELKGDELVDFIGAVADFFDKLAGSYGEKSAAKNDSFDVTIQKDSDEIGKAMWSFFAETTDKSQNTVSDNTGKNVNPYGEKQDSKNPADTVNTGLSTASDTDKDISKTEKTSETQKTDDLKETTQETASTGNTGKAA